MRVGPVFILLTFVTFTQSALAANPRAENAALDAIGKAEGDFLAMNYASGAARLDKALRGCAPSNCSAGTQAALLRDIGTMEFRAGDKGFATKAFGEALKLQPSIDLNPSYDSPDLRAAWMELKGGGPSLVAPTQPAGPSQAAPSAAPNAAVPPPPTFPQPSGEFMHLPAAEQKIDTPLPVFIEGGPNGVFHVVIRYKNSEQGDDAEWNHMDLTRMGAGWGGVIPCNQVVGGTLRYYIQAFNKDMDPVGANGDAKNPYQVPIREELYGAAPHLPNRPAPKACHQAKKGKESEAAAPADDKEKDTAPADCPPGMPGCGKAETSDDEEAKSEEESDDTKGGRKKKKRKDFPRWWIGVGFHLDFMQIPSGSDLCRLQPKGATAGYPANDKHFYCTDSSGNDFPTHASSVQNDQLSQGTAGQSGGGVVPGNLRLMLSVDYALTGNVLLGVRGGYAFLTYPSTNTNGTPTAAVTQGYAWGQKFYLEGRVSGVLGKDPLAKAGFAPILFVGGGVSPFEAKTSDSAGICVNARPPNLDMNPACNSPGNQPKPGTPPTPGMNNMGKPTPRAAVPVDLWITNGPFFVGLGGGIRYAPVPRVALIGAVRLNMSFGSNGIIPTVGPEIDAEVGF